jgi:hypothetical protein
MDSVMPRMDVIAQMNGAVILVQLVRAKIKIKINSEKKKIFIFLFSSTNSSTNSYPKLKNSFLFIF